MAPFALLLLAAAPARALTCADVVGQWKMGGLPDEGKMKAIRSMFDKATDPVDARFVDCLRRHDVPEEVVDLAARVGALQRFRSAGAPLPFDPAGAGTDSAANQVGRWVALALQRDGFEGPLVPVLTREGGWYGEYDRLAGELLKASRVPGAVGVLDRLDRVDAQVLARAGGATLVLVVSASAPYTIDWRVVRATDGQVLQRDQLRFTPRGALPAPLPRATLLDGRLSRPAALVSYALVGTGSAVALATWLQYRSDREAQVDSGFAGYQRANVAAGAVAVGGGALFLVNLPFPKRPRTDDEQAGVEQEPAGWSPYAGWPAVAGPGAG